MYATSCDEWFAHHPEHFDISLAVFSNKDDVFDVLVYELAYIVHLCLVQQFLPYLLALL